MRIFVPITKIDVEKRQVWGRAVQEVPDRAKEIFDYDSSKPLFEKWSSSIADATKAAGQEVSLGNVRAMHGKVAAGKLSSIDFNDADKAIDVCSDVVDDNEWAKCLKGVYTGFSIGGKYVKKWADGAVAGLTRYTADPSEISLVDLPCVPTATFAMVKAAGIEEQVSFAKYAVLADALANPDLTNGEVLTLAQEYLSEDTLAEVAKADSNYLGRLQQLVTENVETVEKVAEVEVPAVEPAPADAAPTNSEGDEATKTDAPDARATLKATIVDKLSKGMWTVSDLAQLLMTISYMAQDAEWEAKYENDNSSVPGDLRAWLSMGIELFKKMSAEETAELIASITPPGEIVVETLELSAGDDLGKAGARHSKKDLEKVQGIHDHATALGATCGAEKAAPTGGLAKAIRSIVVLVDAVTLAKGAAPEEGAVIDDDTVISLATFAIAKAGEVETLTKKVATLEAIPAAPKGVLTIVPKSTDTTELGKVENAPVVPNPKDPKAVMKAVHAQGGQRITL